MLRPATPLSILLLVAFGLLLISVLSTPIIKAIPLGTFDGTNFGVFGYCGSTGTCSSIEIGYDTSEIDDNGDESDFDLPSSTRSTLSTILIVHPVAAFVTLIMLILALISHLHSPSHSSRYLLIIFILSIVDLLVCLLAFLIDVLLFVPHMAFGSYLVLAATILVALSTLVSCAMRRTIVNRKARKKRIAENAEMSGENFYNRQAKETPMPATMQPTMPMVSGANGLGNDELPVFASYENKEDTRVSDERVPLTSRSPTDRSPNNPPVDLSNPQAMYNGPVGPGPRRAPSRDQFGNPINQPPDAYGMRRPSVESQRSRGRGGMPPGGYRGRGGYGPPRGAYGGYGPMPGPGPGRGGYGPPGRGGYGPGPGRGGYGPPPRGYGPSMRGGRPPAPPSYNEGPQDQQVPPAGDFGLYGARQPSPGPPSAPGYGMSNMNRSMSRFATGNSYEAYHPDRDSELPRAESPPPLPGVEDDVADNRAVEMNPRAGSPSQAQNTGQFRDSDADIIDAQNMGQFRDSDADIAGMVGLQQRIAPPARHDTYMSEGSKYSQPDSQYVPVRKAWNQDAGRSSPAHPSALPAPLQPGGSREGSASPQPPMPQAEMNSYVEDVDPRFAEPPVVAPVQRLTPTPIDTDQPFDSVPEGARSPAESERSTFTSISQRGINPRWPGNAPPAMGYLPPRKPVQQRNILLDSNPDFQLPGSRGGGPRSGL